MQLFISHATADIEIAQALRLRIDELPNGPGCFLLSDDVNPADDWEHAIRRAASLCDAIVCIVTHEYVDRPWFVAEWSVFWYQEKPWYILAHEIDAARLFEPMRRRQIVPLDNWRLMSRFLNSLPGAEGINTDLLANEIVREVERILRYRAIADVEANFAKLASSLDSGTDNVDRRVVENVRRGGHLAKAVASAISSGNSVKMRQFAVILLELGEVQEATHLSEAVPNRAERRTIAARALKLLGIEQRQELLDLVISIYSSVRNPQRRDLQEEAEKLGLNIDWPTLRDAP